MGAGVARPGRAVRSYSVPPICADMCGGWLCDTLDVIRPYTDEDLADVLDVWYLASLDSHSFVGDDFFDIERQQIAEQWLPASETSVFEIDGRVVGSVSMIGNEVGGIFVTPEHQHRGIGRALMAHVAASRSYLELDVFEANAVARRFYELYGFRVVNQHINDTTDLPELRLRLDVMSS
jgi:putative acetyltransferase